MHKEFNIGKAGVFTGLLVCVVSLLIVWANLPSEIIVEKDWQVVQVWSPLGAEGNPGAGASGFLEIYFMNLSTWTSGGYGVNTTATLEGWCNANMPTASPNAWASADNFEITSFESEKTFVIGTKWRWNDTHAKDGANWFGNDTNVKITVTCDNWVVGANINNVSGNMIESSNNSAYTYLYTITWWTNGGVGYQIADDATLTIAEIYGEAKF